MTDDKPVFMVDGVLVYVTRTMKTGNRAFPDLLQLKYDLGNDHAVTVNYQQVYTDGTKNHRHAQEFFDKFARHMTTDTEQPSAGLDKWTHRRMYDSWQFASEHNDFCVVKVEALYRLSGNQMAYVVCEFAQYMLEEHQMVMVMGPTLGNNHTPEFVFRKL